VSSHQRARRTRRADGVRAMTALEFAARKRNGEKLVVVTAYDALFGRLVDEAGVDAVLVGDSLGNVLAGYETTIPVTLEQMIYHAAATCRGVKHALVIVDMPFLTYQRSAEQALRNCGRVIQQSGAHAVKLEGASDAVLRAIDAVASVGIPVMGHLGFTPQSVLALGGSRVQGRDAGAASRLSDEARRLEDAGVFAIVLELLPAAVASAITTAVSVPTIGIGAGPGCDGQVLVLHDLLGLNDSFQPRFLRRYASLAQSVRDAVAEFGTDVREGRYPDDEHSF
jgi:3-methyl-2-oxobutanoate hydroxymethyltransferase